MLDMALSAQDQFFAELHSIPVYSDEEQSRLVVLIRQGDEQARQRLVESLLRVVIVYATRLVPCCKHLSLLDLVQIGSEALLESVDRAVQMASPCAYLLKTARYEMSRRCRRGDSPIVTPEHEQGYGLVSLDKPLTDDGMLTLTDLLAAPGERDFQEREHTALYEALSRLSEEHRVLLARRFGLLGYAPTSPYELAREMLPELPVKRAYMRMNKQMERALDALKRLMSGEGLSAPEERPHEFYSPGEIEELYGAERCTLRSWACKGLLRRYPAPAGLRRYGTGSGRGRGQYVYAKAEVDAFLQDWSPYRSRGVVSA